MTQLTTADRIALYAGGGLVLLGVVLVGLAEMIGGAPHPVATDGQIEHEALVPLEIRSYVILLGLLLWAGYGIYRVVATTPAVPATASGHAGSASVDAEDRR